MNTKYLEDIVINFVRKDRRDRLLGFLSTPKRYDDFLEALLRDDRFFDKDCIVKLRADEQNPASVHQAITRLGASGKCYVASLDVDLDGQILDLHKVLEKVVGTSSESLVYVPNGPAGYFEGHEGWRMILRRKN